MIKKIIGALAGILLFTVVVCAEAADKNIGLVVNGRQVPIESQYFFHEGRLFVPIRIITEELGAQVFWDDEDYSVVISQDQGNGFLKGQNFSNGSGSGINNNLIKAADLKDILDDDKDNDLVDYRQGQNGGDRMNNDPLVVDLRKKEDYDMRHIPGAVWIDSSENMAEAKNIQKLKNMLDKHIADGGKNEIVVYCYSGNTSGLVTGVLGTYGLPVRSLMYGFDIAWRGTSTAYYPIYAPMEDSKGQKLLCGG